MDESTLIRRCQNGDEAAFEMLIAPHQEKVFVHLISIIQDQNMAEDVMQEALISAYSHLKDFHQKSSFGTWFWRIAHNKALSCLRKKKAARQQELHEEFYPATESASSKMMDDVLLLLPNKQRECYRMFVFEGRSQKEIAETLQIPLGTVRSRIHYARRKIKGLEDVL